MAQLISVEQFSLVSPPRPRLTPRKISPQNRHHSLCHLLPGTPRRSRRQQLGTFSALSTENSFRQESTRWSLPFPAFEGLLRSLNSVLEDLKEESGGEEYNSEPGLGPKSTNTKAGVNFTSELNREDRWRIASTPRELPRSEWAYRREITLYGLGVLLSLQAILPVIVQPALAEDLVLDAPAPEAPAQVQSRSLKPDTTVTHRVYLDFQLCPTAVRLERTLGDRSLICRDGEPMGRVVLGLYGNQVPVTVQHFVDMVTGKAGSSYKGSIIHKSLPGQYIMAGRQGSVEKGEVKAPSELESNPETVQSRSFLLDHMRPGTVSLALSENDDEAAYKDRSTYRNVEFLITTGPGPASQLDSRNVVFGTVLEGMDVVRSIADVPTYQPNERIRQFNDFATLLGDERAAKGRAIWAKPLKAIVIGDCGVVESAPQPLLPPSQP